MTKSTKADAANPFGDLEKFKLPGVDMAALMASGRKEMDAVLAANKAAIEAMQELALKQAEIFSQAMQSARENLDLMIKNGAVIDPVKHNEIARKAYEKALAQMGELAEMARKAQADAMAMIGKRAAESAEEIKKALKVK